MNHRVARPRIENIIAILALVLGALIPSLVQLLATPGSDSATAYAMCTSTGMKFVKLPDSGDPDNKDPGATHVAKCSLCLWNSHALGMVSASVEFTHPGAVSPTYPTQALGPPPSPVGWLSPPPRAPPFFS